MSVESHIQHFYDASTHTLSYVLYDDKKNGCVIDPVWNYEPASSTLSFEGIDQITDFIKKNTINLQWIFDTHIHADHISGAHTLQERFPGARTVVGQGFPSTSARLADHLGHPTPTENAYDCFMEDQQEFTLGTSVIRTLHVPGHTPICYSLLWNGAVFTGDALFMPDSGVARCDFPGGDAKTLYNSITQSLYTLPEETRTFTGHDYQPNGRELQFESNIGDHKRDNIHLSARTSEEDFVVFRTQRDAKLGTPRLFYPSIQLNIQGGRLPESTETQGPVLKTPLHVRKKD